MGFIAKAVLDGSSDHVHILQLTTDGAAVIANTDGEISIVGLERLKITFPLPGQNETEKEDNQRRIEVREFAEGRG